MIEENDKTSLHPQKIDENTASNISLTGRKKDSICPTPSPPFPRQHHL